MVQLNKKATALIVRLIDHMNESELTEIEVCSIDHPFIARFGNKVKFNSDIGIIFDMGVFLDKSRRKYMSKMEFLIVDNRQKWANEECVQVFPVSFQDDLNDILEESCNISNGIVQHTVPLYQMTHAKQAWRWFQELNGKGGIFSLLEIGKRG